MTYSLFPDTMLFDIVRNTSMPMANRQGAYSQLVSRAEASPTDWAAFAFIYHYTDCLSALFTEGNVSGNHVTTFNGWSYTAIFDATRNPSMPAAQQLSALETLQGQDPTLTPAQQSTYASNFASDFYTYNTDLLSVDVDGGFAHLIVA